MTFEEKKFGNQDITPMNTEQQATVIIPCFNVEAYIIDCFEIQGDSGYTSSKYTITESVKDRLPFVGSSANKKSIHPQLSNEFSQLAVYPAGNGERYIQGALANTSFLSKRTVLIPSILNCIREGGEKPFKGERCNVRIRCNHQLQKKTLISL